MQISKKSSIQFVILMGLISLLADVTYEGARSINGPFLAILGASATVVGFVSGFGELLGYGLRFFSGYFADKTHRYWAISIAGYFLNLFAVPALALAGRWEIAAALIIAERVGKAVRTPARDAMLSYATKQMGAGWGFGLHEAMDQIGAMLGPIIVAVVIYFKGGYKTGFAVLLIPAILAMVVLFIARFLYPRPQDLEIKTPEFKTKGLNPRFWIYLFGISLIAAGYADFPLIAYHFKKIGVVSDNLIPIFYAVAMGVDAIAALLFGRIFDKIGISVLVFAVLLSVFFAPFVFLGNFYMALIGAALWGVGMGAQESVMRAAVSELVPSEKRGTAFGMFNAGYGISWFLGSALMGILYDISIPYVIIFSVAAQLASIPFFIAAKGKYKAAI